jgi:hypothetical protein
MPLYTYVVSYNGRTFVDQDRKSNFKGFTSRLIAGGSFYDQLGLTKDVRQEMTGAIARASWAEAPNREKVWQTEIVVGGKTLSMFAIDTRG